jgi:ribonuclease R
VLVRVGSAEGEDARLIKRLGQSAHRILGVLRKGRGEMRVEPVDRRTKSPLVVPPFEAREMADGDLVLVQIDPAARPYGPKAARLVARLGREDDPRAASLIAAQVNGLPMGFSLDAIAEAGAEDVPDLKGRTDLRHLALVTIDPPDARDHDDAVFAEADPDPRNAGGWIVWVAIADVAACVRPGTALDREAREKGNSVYFPDRVEPMLPEALSAGLCSLGQGVNRACLAVRMVFDKVGAKRSHRFVRGLMRSAASLTYEGAQAAIDGHGEGPARDLLTPVLRPLWSAYGALAEARAKRSPLEIATIERRVILGPDGGVVGVRPRPSLEAHRLIEELMIQANVAAAETLERARAPLIYRVHDTPSADKLRAFGEFLATLNLPWSAGETVRTQRFNDLLARTRDGPNAGIINEVVLRTQAQAIYATDNIGHFGLNLARYAHFTSPIRRYADLIVHRALIGALGLGEDGLSSTDTARLEDTASHLSMTERRAMAAEREAVERYIASFLADHVGAEFGGVVSGVTRFGLFVRLDDTGADGIVPMSALGRERFMHEEASHSLVGERTGARWRLGAKIDVRLREANPVTGGLVFEILSDPEAGDSGRRPPVRRQFRGRPRRA